MAVRSQADVLGGEPPHPDVLRRTHPGRSGMRAPVNVETLTSAILEEVARRQRNTDEAAQPSEVVDLTQVELDAVNARYRELGRADAGTGVVTRFLGLTVRVVETPGPCRVHSWAEIWTEARRREPPMY